MTLIPKYFAFLLFIFCQLNVSGQFNPVSKTVKSYIPGEQLFYTVKVGPIHGGDASLSLRQANYNSRNVYHAVAEAKTVGLIDRLYGVKDIYESYFDINTSLPFKTIRNIKEGNYKRYQESYFDHEAGTAYSARLDSVIKIPEGILDMVSLRVNYPHALRGLKVSLDLCHVYYRKTPLPCLEHSLNCLFKQEVGE